MTSNSIPALRRLALTAVLLSSAVGAQAGMVYRCPGPVLTYTDQLTVAQARERGCTPIENAPVTVVNNSKPRPVVGGKSPAAAAVATPSSGVDNGRAADTRVSEREQRERDKDARRILDEELRREEEKLALMKKDFNNGEPERQGNERNYQRYIDRVAEMKQAIERKESDLASIRRELARVSGGSEATSVSSDAPRKPR